VAVSGSAHTPEVDPRPAVDGTAALDQPAGVDLGSLEFWGRPAEERDRYFAWLRREAPISRHQPPEDILGLPDQGRMSYWAIVRYEDVRRISRDPKSFCSGRGTQFADAPPEFLEASMSFLAMDAPRHTKLRGLVSAAFTPRQVARIEEGVRVNAARIVREAAPTAGGDFVELIAKRLPLVTISDMIGVPQADRERVVAAADLLVTTSDPEVFGERAPVEMIGESLWTLTEFATELAAHRERNPGDDLMTALVQAEVDGERLTHAEIAAFFVLLSVAGNDTTRHTTSHAMRALSAYPEQRALLMEDLDGRLPLAVEEFVRWASPVMTFRRTTTSEVELHGERLPRRAGVPGPLALRRDARSQSPSRLRRRWPALLPGRLARAHPAALDLWRDLATDSRHRGARARAVAQRLHPRRQAHAVHLPRPRLDRALAPRPVRLAQAALEDLARVLAR